MLVTVEDSCFPSVAFSLSFEQSSFFTLSPLSSPGKVSANPWEGFYKELSLKTVSIGRTVRVGVEN